MAVLKGTNYRELDALLKKKGTNGPLVIGNNTTAERNTAIDNGAERASIVIRLHDHPIVTLTWQSVWVYDAGYKTVTTRERLNQYLPQGYGVVQRKKEWFLQSPDGETPWTGHHIVPKFSN